MKNALYPLYAITLLFAAALAGCLFGPSSDASANPGEITDTSPYKVEGNTFITLAHTRTHVYCNGEELRTETDTVEANTAAFRIEDPALEISGEDTLISGAVIQHAVKFTRQGPGTGLQGLWSATGREFRVVSGTPTETENADLEDDQRYFERYGVYSRSWVRFAGGKITFYRDWIFANLFVADWNGEFEPEPDSGMPPNADSARYAIAIKAVDKHTVELKGRTNGETVRLTMDFDGTTYASDTPGHAPHRYLRFPKACPNEQAPEWFEEFKEANLKAPVLEKGMGMGKARNSVRKMEIPGFFPSAL